MTRENPWRAARWPAAALALLAFLALGLGGWLLRAQGGGAEDPADGSLAVPSSAAMSEAASSPPLAAPPVMQTLPGPETPFREVVVAVEGAVARPGVYRLPASARVHDALARAGGATGEGDIGDINLAAPLRDGTTLAIPPAPVAHRDGGAVVLRARPVAAALNPPEYTRSGWRPPAAPVAAAKQSGDEGGAAAVSRADGKINVNTADQAQLETLPGIGPTFAGRIISERAQEPFIGLEDLRRVAGIGPKRLEALRDLVVFE